ncbi:cobalt transporter [Thermococcus litoralis DSM 5473]|uniref:Cobalt transporter n=1 Tax=Thermococcus litoralis (strain ATCC 51850 / DSM 5473 / JCM 8560 / NS-C) TaxID=523849 RepID=H3ZPE2_THELN|nr:energy-coupling factor transporter transmembrane component T [Thermococcus litoralis]EHR78177.1 cobalt transporter [Thermococcus litoralis DSM 5473]
MNNSNKSLLYKLDPRTKMLMLLGFIIGGVLIQDPIIVLVLLLGVIAIYVKIGLTERLKKLMGTIWIAMILLFLLNFPFVKPKPGEEILLYLIPPDHVPVAISNLAQGIANALRFAFFILVATLLTETTPTADLVRALVKLKMPPEIAISIGIAFSYIPVLVKEFETIIEAQRSRGANFETKNPLKKIYLLIPVIVPAMFISIIRGREIAKVIEARGFMYDPRNRTYRRELKLKMEDKGMIILTFVFVICIAILKSKGYLEYTSTLEYLIRR